MTLWDALTRTAAFFSVDNPWMRDLTVALVTLLAGYLLSNVLGRLLFRALLAVNLDAQIKTPYSASRAASSLLTGLGYAVTLVMALRPFGWADVLGAVLGGLVAMGLLLGLVRGIFDMIPHLFGRRRLLLRAGRRGYVAVAGIEGTILRIGLFETQLRGPEGEQFAVPNAVFWGRPFSIRQAAKRPPLAAPRPSAQQPQA